MNLKLLASAALVMSISTTAHAEERTLKAYYFGDLRGAVGELNADFIKRINEKGKGLIQIATPVSGPSSIPSRQAANAIKGGVVDIAMAPPSYFNGFVKGIEGMVTAEVDPAGQRKNGAFDLINQEFESKLGAHYIGQWGTAIKFYIFTNAPIKTLADFKDMRLRSSATYKPFFEGIGAQPVLISRSETFSALERGVVKGYANPIPEIQQMGWTEITKYRVDPGFYSSVGVTLVNKATWDSLNDQQKAVLSEAAEWAERERGEVLVAAEKKDDAELVKAGIQIAKLPPDDAKKFVQTANDALWANVMKQAPEFGPKLKEKLFK